MYDHDDAAYDEDPDFLGQVSTHNFVPLELWAILCLLIIGSRAQVVLSAKGTTSLPTHETTFPLTRKKERDGMLHLKDRTIPDPCAAHSQPPAPSPSFPRSSAAPDFTTAVPLEPLPLPAVLPLQACDCSFFCRAAHNTRALIIFTQLQERACRRAVRRVFIVFSPIRVIRVLLPFYRYNEAVGGSLTFKYTPAERDIKKRLRAALKPAVNHNAVRRGAAASKQSCALDLSFAGAINPRSIRSCNGNMSWESDSSRHLSM